MSDDGVVVDVVFEDGLLYLELANLSDRVIVLHDGAIRAHLSGADLKEHQIVAASVGGLREQVA